MLSSVERTYDCPKGGAWEAWLLFFLNGVARQAEDASRRIGQLDTLRTAYRQQFTQERSRATLEALVDYLISAPITSIRQAQDNLNLGSYNMIQRNIEKLEALGIVCEITSQKRNRLYRRMRF